MALSFEKPKYSDRIGQTVQTVFGGIDLRKAACDGAIYWTRNMCGDEYPLAAVRKRRRAVTGPDVDAGEAYGLFNAGGKLICAAGGRLYVQKDDGTFEEKGLLESGSKSFAALGDYAIIFPDKKYYRLSDKTVGTLEETWTGTASFADGTYAGQDAKGCRIVTTGNVFPFGVGDAVTISGANDAANNQTIIIREISDNRKSLGFYENSFTVATGQTLTIKRTVPDMDFICENENRLWGCKGSTIYASKLGDPFNWNVFDGLASDSYAVDVGSAGDFTACFAYLGYPIFFKEDHIYKVYGSKPSNYQVMPSATLGVMSGSFRSLAVAGEILYYLSKAGVMAYSGGVPQRVSETLGDYRYRNGVAGSDGVRYYISMEDDGNTGTTILYCYDTSVKQWYAEDVFKAVGFACADKLFAMNDDGDVFEFRSDEPNEGRLNSRLYFADLVEGSPNKKSTAKILVRVELDAGAKLDVYMTFDSDNSADARVKVASLTSDGRKKSFYLPILIRRCDHFSISFEGFGMWRLYSLTREYSEGSPNT